jgi:hypothetical protein
MQKVIEVVDLQRFYKKLQTFSNKLVKRGLPHIQIVEKVDDTKVLEASVNPNTKEETPRLVIPFVRITLELPIELLKVEKCTLLGYAESTSNGSLILHSTSAYSEQRMASLRGEKLRCSHCETIRNRNSTFIYEREDGELLFVGKSCAKEYFGMDLAASLTQFIDLPDETRDEEGMRFRSAFFLRRSEFLAAALFWIKRRGYAPSRFNESSTVCLAATFAYSDSLVNQKVIKKQYSEEFKLFAEQRSALVEEMQTIYDFFLNLTEASEFSLNCKAAILDDKYHKTGLLAYAVNLYFKAKYEEMDAARQAEWAQKKADREAAKALTTHYGLPGERLKMEATLAAKSNVGQNDFGGQTTLFKFFTSNGSELTWFSASDPDIEVGQKFAVTGTVVKHTEFQGIKSTQLSRCRFSSISPSLSA